MKIKYMIPVLFLTSFIFFSCQKEEQKDAGEVNNSPSGSPPSIEKVSDKKQNFTQSADDNLKIPRMIIRTGTTDVEVDNYDVAENKVKGFIQKYQGYIASTSISQNADNKKRGVIEAKVPTDKYDALNEDIKSIGKIISHKDNSSDVTEEYIDLESRLKTQKELEERLLNLLKDKASKLSDVIEVEDKLASVRQKIESIDGRMKMLKSQSDFSTLSINLYEYNFLDVSEGNGFWYEIGQSFKGGLKGMTVVIATLLKLFIAILPLIIIVVLAIYLIRKYLKRKNKK